MSNVATYTVTNDTSALFINTSAFTDSNQTIQVYLSNITIPGKTITVRDAVGRVSALSSQTIEISTLGGVLFADGTSTLQIRQPYGFATFTVRDSNTYYITNTYGLSNESVASVRNLSVSSIHADQIDVAGQVAAISSITAGRLAVSTATFAGTRLIVDDPTNWAVDEATYAPFQSFVNGPFYNYGDFRNVFDFTNLSHFQVFGKSYFRDGVFFEAGANIRGDTTIDGKGFFFNCQFILTNFLVDGPFATTDITAKKSITCEGTLTAASTFTSSLTASTIHTSNLLLTGDVLTIGNTVFSNSPSELFISKDITANNLLYALNLTSSNQTYANELYIAGAIYGSNCQLVDLSGALISNVNGSLLVSSIAAGAATVNSLTVDTASISTATVSSLTVDSLTLTPPSIVDAYLANCANVSAATLSAATVAADTLSCASAYISSLTVAATLDLGQIPLLDISNTILSNTSGSLIVSSLTADVGTMSTLRVSSIAALGADITFQTPLVRTADLRVGAATVSSLQTVAAAISTATVSTPPPQLSSNLFFLDTIANQFPTLAGTGSYLDPVRFTHVGCTNVNNLATFYIGGTQTPPQSWPTTYTIKTVFDFNPNGDTASHVRFYILDENASLYTYTEYSGSGGHQSNLDLQLTTNGVSNMSYPNFAVALYSPSGFPASPATLSVRSYVMNPDTYPTESAIVDTTQGIFFQNGVLRWPYALNGTTIENPYNDMRIRNITYSGAISFFSDPAIKEDVRDANLERCAEIIGELPLRSYSLKEAYANAFHVADRRRLGYLATDVERVFPKSVRPTHVAVPGLPSTLLTVDFQQIQMAHLGATQYLLREVERLEAQIAAL